MRYGGQRACNPAVSAVSTTFVLFSSGNRPKLGTMKLFLKSTGNCHTKWCGADSAMCGSPPAGHSRNISHISGRSRKRG